MKKLFQLLSVKARTLLNADLATKDRPFPFQVFVIAVLLTTILFISYCLIKEIVR